MIHRLSQKHIAIRIEQCLALSKASNCPRRKFGALLLDPVRNVVLADSYNGAARGGSPLCGGDTCARDTMAIKSGERVEIGCIHAEQNLICNAAAAGVATAGMWVIVNGEPCLMCAKLIHQSGITRVLVVDKGYAGFNGVQHLRDNGVEVAAYDGPRDERVTQ
jgi:dCMP deaminase